MIVAPPPLVIGPLFLTLALLPILVEDEAPLIHAPSNVTVGGRPFMSVSYTIASAPVLAAILLASVSPILRLALLASLVPPWLLFVGIISTYLTLVVPVTLSFLLHTGAAWVAAIAVATAVIMLPFTPTFKRTVGWMTALTLFVGTMGFVDDGLPWPWLFYTMEAVLILLLASAAFNIDPVEERRLQKENAERAMLRSAETESEARDNRGPCIVVKTTGVH